VLPMTAAAHPLFSVSWITFPSSFCRFPTGPI